MLNNSLLSLHLNYIYIKREEGGGKRVEGRGWRVEGRGWREDLVKKC